MKLFYLGLTLFCLAFSSCSTHFYKVTGNDVTLYLKKPQAKDVVLFCSLNGYQGQGLRQQGGLWQLSLPGATSFKYFYRVDGEIFIPSCPMKEKDDFGSENCIFEPNL